MQQVVHYLNQNIKKSTKKGLCITEPPMSHYGPIRVIEGVKSFFPLYFFCIYNEIAHKGKVIWYVHNILISWCSCFIIASTSTSAMTGKHINFQGYRRWNRKRPFQENVLVYIQLRSTHHVLCLVTQQQMHFDTIWICNFIQK